MSAIKIIANAHWTAEGVEQTKAEVKQEISMLGTEISPDEKRRRIMEMISDSEILTDPAGLMRQLVLNMSALVHHLHFGGLTTGNVNRLAQNIENILRLQNIPPFGSNVSYVHSEYRSVMSQLHLQEGKCWRSTWEQNLASAWLRDDSPAQQVRYFTAMGRRYLRLGFGNAALQNLNSALSHVTTDRERTDVSLRFANALRLTGRLQEARVVIQELLSDQSASRNHPDVAWEDACLEFKATGDVRPLLRLTKPGKPHDVSGYVAEARLYAYANRERGQISGLSKVESLGRRGVLTSTSTGELFGVLKALENCYDSSVPSGVRLNLLEPHLVDTTVFPSIEKELLVLAAAARWLVRARQAAIADVIFQRYRVAILTLCGRDGADPLGVMDDLLAARP